jgi:hypothetical protein
MADTNERLRRAVEIPTEKRGVRSEISALNSQQM